MNTKKPVERRKHTRFRVQDSAYVALKPSDAEGGRLISISMSGLMFEYLTNQASSIEATELDILLVDGAFELSHVPCQRIWDLPTYELIPTSPLQKRRCGVEFGELTQSQISQLEYFIQNHTTGEVV
jgi:hypothetical protein